MASAWNLTILNYTMAMVFFLVTSAFLVKGPLFLPTTSRILILPQLRVKGQVIIVYNLGRQYKRLFFYTVCSNQNMEKLTLKISYDT